MSAKGQKQSLYANPDDWLESAKSGRSLNYVPTVNIRPRHATCTIMSANSVN